MQSLHFFDLDFYNPARVVFAILAALILLKIIASLFEYRRMRRLEVKVVSSKLSIKQVVEPGGRPYEYVLHVVLETTGDSPRQITEQIKIPEATYPEEAYDELAFWAPGTLHEVHRLRGDANEVRIAQSGADNPELLRAKLLIFPAIACVLAVVAFAGASGALGDYVFVFSPFLVGVPMLLGSILLFARGFWRAYRWERVTAKVIEGEKKWDPASVPQGTTVAEPAAAELEKLGDYSVASFQLKGRTFRYGINGSRTLGDEYTFWVNPSDHFETLGSPFTYDMKPYALLFMGAGFSAFGFLLYWVTRFGPNT